MPSFGSMNAYQKKKPKEVARSETDEEREKRNKTVPGTHRSMFSSKNGSGVGQPDLHHCRAGRRGEEIAYSGWRDEEVRKDRRHYPARIKDKDSQKKLLRKARTPRRGQ